jgi:hypothetical protein
MKHKQTEAAAAMQDDELPLLNAAEAAFVEAIGSGDNNIEAYRKAFGAGGYNPNALRVEACRKAASPRIQVHLRHLRAAGLARASVTLQQRIEEEYAFAARCEAANNWGAAGCTYDRLNKLCGLYVDKAEIVLTSTPEQTLRELASMIGEDPDKIEVKH